MIANKYVKKANNLASSQSDEEKAKAAVEEEAVVKKKAKAVTPANMVAHAVAMAAASSSSSSSFSSSSSSSSSTASSSSSSLSSASAAGASAAEQDIFWTIGHQQFLDDFRVQIVVDAVSRRLNSTAGYVAEILLLGPTASAKDRTSNAMEASQILAAFDKRFQKTVVLTNEGLSALLEEMLDDSVNFVFRRGSGFAINTDAILEMVRLNHSQSIIRERFGIVGARLFGLLMQ